MINTNKDKRLTAKRIAAIKKGITRAERNARVQSKVSPKTRRIRPEFWEQVKQDYQRELKELETLNQAYKG